MSQAPSDLLNDSNEALLRHILDMRSHESQALDYEEAEEECQRVDCQTRWVLQPPTETRLLRGVIPL